MTKRGSIWIAISKPKKYHFLSLKKEAKKAKTDWKRATKKNDLRNLN